MTQSEEPMQSNSAVPKISPFSDKLSKQSIASAYYLLLLLLFGWSQNIFTVGNVHTGSPLAYGFF